MRLWNDKPYHSLDYELKKRFGEKVYRLALNGGMTCPNRDGTVGHGGCIFCSGGGSGEFASDPALSIREQIESGKERLSHKRPVNAYIAYFQAFTNTYAPVEYLRRIFTEAIEAPEIEILAVATRPDCLEEEKIQLLAELNRKKPVWVELGLQSAKEESAWLIRRGYENKVFENALKQLISRGIDVIVHIIIGIPGESREDILNTVKYINSFDIKGVKIQLLHVLRGTDLEQYYYEYPFHVYTMEEYTQILCDVIEHLRRDIVIHRLTGDGPKKLLIEPQWSGNKRAVMNYIHREMQMRNIEQGAKAMVTGGLLCQ